LLGPIAKELKEDPKQKVGEKMNKADLVAEVAKVVGSKKMAERAVSCTFEAIKKGMQKGQGISLVGFGTFSVGKRKARVGRNPQTGVAIKISAKKVPKFMASEGLKAAVSGYKSTPGGVSAISPIIYKCPRCKYRLHLRIVPSELPRCPKHVRLMQRKG
jgi:nucleoid DNA-binding protein